ncbi:FMN-binding protein [Proteinivorax tanatarense]|uniref:FMN-binding protein n=1 Tax=Proteinivorax tanatarense TaxID=1260629 RepID=A0AAU7VQG1_9FIRM
MKKFLIMAVVSVMALGLFAGCSGESMYEDGTYVAYSTDNNWRGYLETTVVIEDDEIVSIDVTEYNNLGEVKDYASYGSEEAGFTGETLEEAHTTVAQNIIDSNSTDVDGFTGATSSSDKIVDAVEAALAKADGSAEGEYFDGSFFGEYSSYSEDRETTTYYTAVVTVENDSIVDVELREFQKPDGEEVIEKDEEYAEGTPFEGEWQEAVAEMPGRFVEADAAEVEVFTGATSSSEGWMQAVEKALERASIN